MTLNVLVSEIYLNAPYTIRTVSIASACFE